MPILIILKLDFLPAFILTDAHKTLQSMTQQLQSKNPQATALDALIETATLHHVPSDEHGTKWTVETIKKGRGWLVPIPVGIKAFHQHLMQAKCKIAVTLNTQANMLRH